MIVLQLKTVSVHERGCFSVLLGQDGLPLIVTLERTFDPDQRTVIVNGEYECYRDMYHKGGYETFQIMVPGHTRVLFHIGNVEEDSSACILTGERFDGPVVRDSRVAFGRFMKYLENVPSFLLQVSGR